MRGSPSLARRRVRWMPILFLVGVALTMFAFVGTAAAAEASDPRAEFVNNDNATTCADVGDSSPNILEQDGNADKSDGNVSGTVSHNPPRDTLNVVVLNPAFQVNAVVVKGGNGYNVYRGNFPDMITPNTNGGPPAGFSHWYVCYGPAQPPPTPPGPPGPPGGEGSAGAPAAPGAEQAGAAAAVTARARFTG
jgi:hypothetical protein